MAGTTPIGNWLDDMRTYVTQKPDASDDDLYQHFPQLRGDSKRIDAAMSYFAGRDKGMTDEQAQKMYPDLFGGPSRQQVKKAIGIYRQSGETPSVPEVSKNPASKPFKEYEEAGNRYVTASSTLDNITHPMTSVGTAPNWQLLEQQSKEMTAQKDAYKKQLMEAEVSNSGTLKDINQEFARNYGSYLENGQINYGKIHDDALAQSRKYGGDRYVAELIYNQAANTIRFKQLQPEIEGEFKKITGKSSNDYLGSVGGGTFEQLRAHYQHDFDAEARRSQDIISTASQKTFDAKYKPQLEAVAQQFGQDSVQFKQAYAEAQKGLASDLRNIQMKENARLLRIRSELNRSIQAQGEKVEGENQGLLDNYRTLYSRAYENVLKNHDAVKKAATGGLMAGEGMTGLFIRSLWSGLNSWAATRGAGLVGAGFNNPLTDWLRSRQTAAEASDLSSGGINPASLAVKGGQMIGSMAPDLVVTALTKSPTLSGLEFTASSTLSGMGDVYNQAKADGYTEEEAQKKVMDFAHKNFIATLPANMLMGSAIAANLRGAGGIAANLAKEAAGGLGASLPQQYLEQAQSREGKTLGQYLREDAPRAAIDNLIALAAGAPVMRAVGHLSSAMASNRIPATQEQFFSDLIDKHGLPAVEATMELQYLNGAIDLPQLETGKKMLTWLIGNKAGLTELGVHSDLQKLAFQKQQEIANLQQVKAASSSEPIQKLYDSKIKELQGQLQDIAGGKASYIKMTTAHGVDFVIPADKAEAILSDPAVQRDVAEGHLKAQAFGDEKDVAKLTEKINAIGKAAANTDAAVSEKPDIVASEKPSITEVRHGETDEDVAAKVSGPDGIPLNETGQQQIDKLASEAELRGFTKVVGSDVPRNIATGKAVADRLGIPHEMIPGFNSWDIGDWNGQPEADYIRAERYFVDHPDATEFEGKRINESFNQYKDRVIKARQELEEKNQHNTLLVNHSSNIKLWEALQKSGGVWDEAAKQHYFNAPDAEPAILPPTEQENAAIADAEKPENHPATEQAYREEKAILDAHDPAEHDNIARLYIEENENIDNEKTTEPAGPVRSGDQPDTGRTEINGETGRSAPDAATQERLSADDESQGRKAAGESETGEPLSDRFGARDEFERALVQYSMAPGMRAATGGPSGPAEPEFNESDVKKLIQRSPVDMTDPEISQVVQHMTGWDENTVNELIQSAREEQAKGAKQLVQEALERGKQVAAKAKALATPTEQSPVLKKLGRWFFDQQDDVSDVKSVIRTNKGQEEYELDKTWHASRKLVNQWNRVPSVDQMAFILGIERPDLREGWGPKQREMADMYRERLNTIYNQLIKALPDLNFREDYFPHFWEKPDEVKNYFASALGKAPLEGSKSFAKQRFYDTILQGLEKGYKLTTTNPEELVRLAEAQAWKFITAKNIFADMQKLGYLKFSTANDVPTDWRSVDDKLFNRIGASVTKDGDARLNMGSYMMPPDVAKLVNQYLSPGLKGSLPDFIRNYNNIKNAFQLGVGAFHLGTTSLESTVSGVARGIQLLTSLNPINMLKGLGQIAGSATFVPNLAMDLRRGWKAIADYHKGLVTDDVQNLINANAKIGRQKMYSLDAKYNMMKAFGRLRADGDFSGVPKALWNALLFLPEAINKPLMEKWVPGLKVGGYLRSLDAELAVRKDMSPRELQQAKEKIWDSMDDRLGQVVYDNRFINKIVKDLGFMSIRSLGWTGGTLAAGTKGVGEIPLSGKRLLEGKGLTQRTAYLFALPLTVGLYGAYYQLMTTGKGPDSLTDYFFPKDGTKNPDGTDHRVALPSYMKDLLAYSKSPVTTLIHKTSPIINDAAELYMNKDFYGAKIYGEDDPFFKRGLEKLQYLAGNMEPFSFRQKPGDEVSLADQFLTRKGLEQKFGIMPAPKERERTDLQNKIIAAYSKQFGSEEGKTQEEMERQIARRHLREFLFNGGSWEDASEELRQKAAISENAVDKFITDSQMDPYERAFRGLPKETKIKLYEQMSEDEKEQYRQYLPDDYNPDE